MGDTSENAVERVIAAMHDNLGEELTIDDMARVAMFSKFHFSRMFLRVTGVSPGRFLSALRLQRAKQLLVSTQFNISDISLCVGYTSVGTFSSRFTRSVGLSPTAYRRLGGIVPQIRMDSRIGDPELSTGTVKGMVWAPATDKSQLTFVGLFRDRVPEGRPVSCAVLDRSGPFLFDKVPPGGWYLLAHSVCANPQEAVSASALSTLEVAVSTSGPITMRRDMVIESDARLQPVRTLDPPVLMALLDVRIAAMNIIANQSPARYQTVVAA